MDQSTIGSESTPSTSSGAAEATKQVASTAAGQGKEVAKAAGEGTKEIAGTVKDQASQVGQEVAAQTRNLVGETKTQLQGQARVQTDQLAKGLQRVGDQVRSLAEGRSDDAGPLKDYAHQAAAKLSEWGSTVDQRGFEGVVEDLQRFARRRPGAFLAGAAFAGFAMGRLVRGAMGNSSDSGVDSGSGPVAQQRFATTYASTGYAAGEPSELPEPAADVLGAATGPSTLPGPLGEAR